MINLKNLNLKNLKNKGVINFIIIIIIILIIFIIRSFIKEGFHLWDLSYPTRIYQPTRNMSYDLRGDPYPVPYYVQYYGYRPSYYIEKIRPGWGYYRHVPIHQVGPFNQSTMYPHHNRAYLYIN